MNSLVSYGKLRPAFIGALGVIFSHLLDRAKSGDIPANLRTVNEVIEFADSGIWGDESVDSETDFRVFRVSDFKGDFQLDLNSAPLRSIPLNKKAKYILASGDLLVVKSSGSAKQVVSGRIAVFEPNGPQLYAASNFLLRLRPKKEINPHYLSYALGSPPVREKIADSVKTMTYPNLPFKLYRAIEVPVVPPEDQRQIAAFFRALFRGKDLPDLPPYLSRQRRIVSRIEELATKIEEAHNLRKRATDEIASLRPATLRSLLSGDWPEYPLAEVLREESRNGLSPRPSAAPPGTPILRISAATSREDAVVDENDYKFLEVSERDREKYQLKPGDLLACRFNGNLHFVGRFALFRGESAETRLYPDKLIRFRIDTEKILPEFAAAAMNSYRGRSIIEPMCATTAGNLGISATKLKTVPIPVPPLEEQRSIVAYLDDLQAKVDALKQMQTETTEELDALMPSILSKAFSGEL